MGLLCPVLIALLTLMSAATAHAHSSSNAYLALQQEGERLLLRADVHLRDADLVLDLDTDRDGGVRWGEVAPRQAELMDWMRAGLRLRAPGRACELQPIDLLASERSDGHYLSAQWTVACGDTRPTGLTLRYGLLFERDSLHRALVKVELPGAEASTVLSPDRPEANLLPEQPRSAWAVFGHYLIEGVWHIWIGLDHILFLLSLLLLAPLLPRGQRVSQWVPQPALKPALIDVFTVVTAFTVAHSITLGLAIFRVVALPAVLIETVIAASVVLAALNNLLGGFSLKRWRLAFVFGLIHGFGFANVLLDLELPATQLAVALGGFNLGVEVGQLAIVAVFFPLAWALRHTALYRRGAVVGGSIAIALAGTWWIAERLGWLG